MEREINFRIVELKTVQVLLTKDFDSEKDDANSLLVITFFLDGIKVNLSLGYDLEEKRDEIFDGINDEKLQNFVSDARRQFED